MSGNSAPITPSEFAEALTALPTSSLFAKASEIRNAIAHLRISNVELRNFVEASPGGDHDCEEAIAENIEVIARMEERIALVKVEAESRGSRWDVYEAEAVNLDHPDNREAPGATHNGDPIDTSHGDGLNGAEDSTVHIGSVHQPSVADEQSRGSMEELVSRFAAEEDEEDGIHL